MIDVGQAVEHDHPHALEFLRIDCYNITNFFRLFSSLSRSIYKSHPPQVVLT
jgi:serine/threonine-protein kinase RIO1